MIRLSDFIAKYIVELGVTDVFTVVGGGAMYLNDSFGHNPLLTCYYNHHEQASAIAAEAYARINNKIALLCVTTGPGGTNAMTGVVGGWMDSIPMLIISGQVRSNTMARSCNLNLRSMGDQEYDITKSIQSMTKYSELVLDPNKIKYYIHKAFIIATSGRPGPCWLDIPLDVQSALIDESRLVDYSPDDYLKKIPHDVDNSLVELLITKIEESKRPVMYAGNGIRLSGGFDIFDDLKNKLGIPVVTNWNSIDLISSDDPLFAGRAGNLGDRPGNFAVENSDLILSIGSRLGLRQIGFNYSQWAKHSYVIMEDVDENEIKKPTLHVDLPLHIDAKSLMEKIVKKIPNQLLRKKDWIAQCQKWISEFPVLQPKHRMSKVCNPYYFMHTLSLALPDGQLIVVGNGTASVVGSQAFVIKHHQRFIINNAISSMGYDLPASIGTCVAANRSNTICITGDGSIMMNLQELQTIVKNDLPIKIFILNNNGYHSIRLTQTNLFNKQFCGIGEESGDLSFPDFEKIAFAFGYQYYKINNHKQLKIIPEILKCPGYCICEVILDTDQIFEPKSATKKLSDGSLYSPPLNDMAPFLSKKELAKNSFYEDQL